MSANVALTPLQALHTPIGVQRCNGSGRNVAQRRCNAATAQDKEPEMKSQRHPKLQCRWRAFLHAIP